MKFFFALGLLVLFILACGPAAESPQGATLGSPTDAPPQETEPAREPEAPEEPTPSVPEVKPTWVPTPEPPYKTPEPQPSPIPPAIPEGGLEGCKALTIFGNESINAEDYVLWCSSQLTTKISRECEPLETIEAQRECGDGIVSEYKLTALRYGIQCVALTWHRSDPFPRGDRPHPSTVCLQEQTDEGFKVINSIYEAWAKVRVVGNRNSAVIEAMKDVNACLEERGYKDIDPELLFIWQRLGGGTDKEHQYLLNMTEEDRKLGDDLMEPSRDCGKMHGLFEALEKPGTARMLISYTPYFERGH